MNKLLVALTVMLAIYSVQAVVNNCHPSCGGNTTFNCADYLKEESSDQACYSCAAGFVGGVGFQDGVGAPCRPGQCLEECASCKYSNDSSQCYICSFGFYDPVGDITKSTPCVSCHPSCGTCSGPTANDCLICAEGYFDSFSSPYYKGSCSKCDDKCNSCTKTADNCVSGCCGVGFAKQSNTSYECVLSKTCAAAGTTCPTRPQPSPTPVSSATSAHVLLGYVTLALMIVMF